MSNFRNILVYAEAADAGCLAEIVALAEQSGAALSVCDVIAHAAAWFRRLADDIAARSPGIALERHLERGTAVSVIPRLARAVKASLVVLGTVSTSAPPGLLIGTTAEAILAAAETPTLALKPRGFTSPIQFTDAAGAERARGTTGGTAP
jgi:nucleotide-binding universal stress UspA family protein